MCWSIELRHFIKEALSILSQKIDFDMDAVFSSVTGFFRERYKQMMLRSGYETSVVEAVISAEFNRIDQLRERIENLNRFVSESNEFEALTLTFKRVKNILKKQKEEFEVDPGLFTEKCESRLWMSYQSLRKEVYLCLEKGDYDEALNLMSKLRKPVDDFFDGVEILTKASSSLRQNRLGLLQQLAKLFFSVADFSKFSV